MAIPDALLARYIGCIDPERQIVVAGTNGKGSVCAALSAGLTAWCRSKDTTVSCFTSPHLVHPRERFRLNDLEISVELFDASQRAVAPWAKQFSLTQFEAYTLQALHIWYSGDWGPPPAWSIWEVGLGGRRDPTNQIPHRMSAITALGLDHQDVLGNTLESIAFEKFGIITAAGTVVAQPLDPILVDLQHKVIEQTRCHWIEVQPPRQPLATALAGARGQINSAHALRILKIIGVPDDLAENALQNVRWPGRFSSLHVEGLPCPAFVSGDHNLQGIESLCELLETRFKQHPWKRTWILWAHTDDRAAKAPALWDCLQRRLSPLAPTHWAFTQTPYKPSDLTRLPAFASPQNSFTESNPRRALQLVAERSASDDLVIATGSLYLAGALLG